MSGAEGLASLAGMEDAQTSRLRVPVDDRSPGRWARRSLLAGTCGVLGLGIAAFERFVLGRRNLLQDPRPASASLEASAPEWSEITREPSAYPRWSVRWAMALCAASDEELTRNAVDFLSVVKREPCRSILVVGCKRLVEMGLSGLGVEPDRLMDLGLSGLAAIGSTASFADYRVRITRPGEYPRSLERIERARSPSGAGK